MVEGCRIYAGIRQNYCINARRYECLEDILNEKGMINHISLECRGLMVSHQELDRLIDYPHGIVTVNLEGDMNVIDVQYDFNVDKVHLEEVERVYTLIKAIPVIDNELLMCQMVGSDL